MQKLSTKFEFVVNDVSRGHQIILTQIGTDSQKEFFIAGDKNKIGIINFMNSLTDDLCAGYFNTRVVKPKSK